MKKKMLFSAGHLIFQGKDKERQSAIESLGLTVILFTNEEVKQRIESCIEIIRNYITSQPLQK